MTETNPITPFQRPWNIPEKPWNIGEFRCANAILCLYNPRHCYKALISGCADQKEHFLNCLTLSTLTPFFSFRVPNQYARHVFHVFMFHAALTGVTEAKFFWPFLRIAYSPRRYWCYSVFAVFNVSRGKMMPIWANLMRPSKLFSHFGNLLTFGLQP